MNQALQKRLDKLKKIASEVFDINYNRCYFIKDYATEWSILYLEVTFTKISSQFYGKTEEAAVDEFQKFLEKYLKQKIKQYNKAISSLSK